MNFSFSAAIATIIKWFHDLTMNHDERISALEANAGIQSAPRPEVPPEVVAHVAAAGGQALGIDYARYAKDSPLTIQTQRFPGGLPPAWDWAEWAKVSGQLDPRTHGVTGGSLTSQPTGEAVVWGAQLDWSQNGGVRHQHARANEDVVFDFTIPDSVADGTAFWLASPIGPASDGDTATRFTARVDGGEPQEMLLTAVGGVTHNLVVGKDIARGAHRYILRFNGDRYDARAQLGGHS